MILVENFSKKKQEKFQNLPQEFKPLGMAPENNQIEFDEN